MKHKLYSQRWIVEAEYPGSPYNVGHIIHRSENLEGKKFFDSLLNGRYNKIFRELGWWEHRTIEQMPKYIKFAKDYIDHKKGQVFKFENWSKQFEQGMIPFRTGPGKDDLSAIPPRSNGIDNLIPIK